MAAIKDSVFYFIAAGFFAAAFLFSNIPTGASIAVGIAALAASVLIRLPKFRRFAAASTITISIAAGFVYSFVYSAILFAPVDILIGSTIENHPAVICEEPTGDGVYTRAVAKVDSPVGFLPDPKMAFYYDTREFSLQTGDRITLSGTLSDSRERGTYYISEGIALYGDDVAITGFERPEHVGLSLLPARTSGIVRQRIDELFGDDEVSGFVRALISGDTSRIASSFRADLSDSGLSHVVSVSGMHLAFLAGILMLFVPKRIGPFIIIPTIWFFAAMTGFSPSALRAAIMLSITLLAPLFGRDSNPLNSLAAALILILTANPYAAGSLSFMLSFLATLGLLLFSSRLTDLMVKPLPEGVHRAVRPIASAISVSLSATVLTLPVLAVYMGRVSLISPISNLACIWAVEACFALAVPAVALSFFFPPLAHLLAAAVPPLAR